MNKLITEFIGTFFLVLVVCLNGNAGILNAVAIGSVLIGLIYAGGHVSGAHYNPAVTLAFFIRGKISVREGALYLAVQLLGAVCASLIAVNLFDVVGTGLGPMIHLEQGMVAEILGTFAMTYVILNVATAKGTQGNHTYGLAIGLTAIGCGYILGKYSGGAFNPAVAIGMCITKSFAWSHLWVYLVSCFGGAAIAAVLFKTMNPANN
jgi:aquaporin Z